MTAFALGLVLFSALLHASWNAMLKAVDDRAGVLGAVSLAHALVGVLLIAVSPLPDRASWPSILISTLVHYGYYLLLFRAYRHGDLSQVYPISRGLAPAFVALSAWFIIGETLSPLGWVGLAAISAGICLLAMLRGAAQAPGSTIGLALLLGVCIGTYSVADGIGIRQSGTATGYMGWLFLFEAPVPLAIALHRHRNRGQFAPRTLILGLLGGVAAVTAYGLVLYVKTIAPLGAVSALRESSVIIAAMIGVVVFGERPWQGRMLAAVVVAVGVIAVSQAG
ncbi:DMT family transporter [Pseudorhodobacter ferrugineus]|uniref:DMT family transporter n=1 Tax=Pseudorhodobacter ferrugineus TaxID=77008 RepID=UPI0003B75594|nr:DMT family transporter [Pseudorhodobacter ferrugineus]